MRIPRIFTRQTVSANSSLELEPGPSAHIARVLRMQVGAPLILFNGQGSQFKATVATLEKKSVVVNVHDSEAIDMESPLKLELGIAVSKGDRMDWIMQKATELGVASIAPLMTERTEVKFKGDRAEKKRLHWENIIISACEQCGRNTLPDLLPVQSLTSWLPGVSSQRRFVLHHRATGAASSTVAPETVSLLIGPEGGLSDHELQTATVHEFEHLTLGPRVLRTETAPMAALSILQARWGDMLLEEESGN